MTPDLLRAVAAHQAFFERVETVEADACFRASAIATAHARARGVSAPVLAQHFKQVAAGRKAAVNLPSYTSPTSIGYHARTGRLLLLASPETDLSARDVQTLVKAVSHALGVGEVERCLRRSRSQAEAVGELRRALDSSRSGGPHREVLLAVLTDSDARLEAEISEIDRLLDEDPELSPDLLERLADLGRRADGLLANRCSTSDGAPRHRRRAPAHAADRALGSA